MSTERHILRGGLYLLSAKQLESIFEQVQINIARRDRVCKSSIPCSKCGSRQQQLTDLTGVPARWRCRDCKHGYVYEPIKMIN